MATDITARGMASNSLKEAKAYTDTFNSQVTNIVPTNDGTGLVFTVVGGETFTISITDWNALTDAEKAKLNGIEVGAQVNTVDSVNLKTGAVILTKTDIGLGEVDNTSDENKPISIATQTALDLKVDKISGKGLSTNDYTNDDKTKVDLITISGDGGQFLSNNGTYTSVAVNGTLGLYYLFANATAGDGNGTIYLFTNNPYYLGDYQIMWGNASGILSAYSAINTVTLSLGFAEKLSYAHFATINMIPTDATCILAVNSGTVISSYTIPTSKLFSAGNYGSKLYSVGVLSDVHIQYDTGASDLSTALSYLNDDQDVVATCLCGDLTSYGTQANLNEWQTARNTDSPSTPVYTCNGNHEVYAAYSYMVNNPLKMLPYLDSSVTSTDDALPYFYKVINNDIYVFVATWMDGAVANKSNTMFNATMLTWLTNLLETYRNQRVFLFMHVPPYYEYTPSGFANGNGAYALDLWGHGSTILTDRTSFTNLLAHYKNVIWFSGHSHIKYCCQETWENLNYARWNTDGAKMCHVSSLTVPRDVADGTVSDLIYAESEGSVMDVYTNCVLIKCRNFVDEKFIGLAQYMIDTTPVTIDPTTATLSSISATKTTTSYNTGDTLSTVDITVTATYSDTTTSNVTSDAVFDTTNVNMSTAGTYNIGVSYTEGGVTKTTTVSITVVASETPYISVTGYTGALEIGGTVQLTGTLSDSGTATITWSTSSASIVEVSSSGLVTAIGAGTATITASATGYTSATQNVVVNEAVVLSSITASKTTTSYNVGDTIATDDIIVTATYSDSTTDTVTGWTTNATDIDMSTAGTKSLVVTYTEDGVTKTYTISLTVLSGTYTENVLFSYTSNGALSFTATEQTKYSQNSVSITEVAQWTPIYAKWDSAEYSGGSVADATTQKVGLIISFNSDVQCVADYTDYSSEVELLNKNTSVALTDTEAINLIKIFRFKSSSSSTASFPVTMSITNFRIYTKVYN